MATFAFDSSDARDASRPPISLHPAFPGIVALWFAALLGVGSMVLPVVLLERGVEASGLAAWVPAAAPPLGFTARGIIALAAAIAGAAVGVVIARRVARAHDGDRPARFGKFASGARRPISVNEELGGEGLINGHGLPVSRRRALAIAEDERPSDFLYMAPLPGNPEEDHPLAFADRPLERPAAPGADDPLELCDAVEDPGPGADFGAFAEPDAFEDPQAALPDEDPPMTFKQEFQPSSPEPPAGLKRQEFAAAPARSEPEPLPFSPPSLARRAAMVEAEAPHDAAPAPEPEPEPEPIRPQPVPAAPEPPPFRGDWASASVAELGLVQLVQRLGASLERRRDRLAAAPDAAPAAPAPAGFEPAAAEDAAQAMAAYFGKPAATIEAEPRPEPESAAEAEPVSPAQPIAFAAAPAAQRPRLLGSWQAPDDDDDLDAMPSFTLPLRRTVSPTIAFAEPVEPQAAGDENDNEPAEGDDGYSSLLAMRNPLAPKGTGFVRIDEPEPDDDAVEPAVVFPGRHQAGLAALEGGTATPRPFDPPADEHARPALASYAAPADTDAALRAALATLQRMSGTA